MTYPEQRIVDFIREHHILTLAVSKNNIPYCATCYYAYLPEQNQFIFTSGYETRHIRDPKEGGNYRVAGAIALETKIVGKIRGIQFAGVIREPEGEELKKARSAYLKRFPIARLMSDLTLWLLDPDFIKMTDNRLGFGKKLIWMG
ncbi:MAG: pyridoxamine 5'-phosphate oxidase family protein [Bacteroidota bacterium]